MDSYRINHARVGRAFSSSAVSYDEHAVLQREIGDRLLAHITCSNIAPSRILDVGSGTGYFTHLLHQHYKKADVTAVDIAQAMLYYARAKRRIRMPWHGMRHYAAADACALPFADASFDLVCSNLALQWVARPALMLTEMRRVLAPDGLMVFSTFGRRTLCELRHALAHIERDQGGLIVPFPDVMAMGNALAELPIEVPVVDSDLFTLTYPNTMALVRELKGLGASSSAIEGRPAGLYGRRLLRELTTYYETHYAASDGRIHATFEALYAQAWFKEAPFSIDIPIHVHG
ncbi:MAG: malonyl-ACP O-methyltransferase BioC [Mariprofundaceae bacterium]|nr:malonyl-ACP O-methyltransferase BioC [Mariprofundaceae bacterium]